MVSNLLAFPCDKELVASFCNKVGTKGSAALILRKQEKALKGYLSSLGISEVYSLPEDLYGRITSQETRAMLAEIHERGMTNGYLPMNDFCGNVALLLATLVQQVNAVNATSIENVETPLPSSEVTWKSDHSVKREIVGEIQKEIVEKLKSAHARIEAMDGGDRAGEKPTSGLILNAAYDCEVLSRYVYASHQVEGQVLEIGCGLGYGAYLMTRLNPGISILAVDYDAQVIEIAQELWGHEPQLRFEVGRVEDSPFPSHGFHAVVCFEVIEHLSNPVGLLEEIRRLLVAGGRFIGSTPNSSFYPYRVNKGLSGTPEELRRAGVWPWHIQEFNEASIRDLMKKFHFGNVTIKYPTFTTGLDLYNRIQKVTVGEKIEELSGLQWSAADFTALEYYVPGFSGYSFMFEGSSHSV